MGGGGSWCMVGELFKCPFLPIPTEIRVQELCESRGGRPGLFVLMSLMVSVVVKQP